MPKNNIAVLDIGSRKVTVLAGERGVNNILNIKGKGEAVYSGFADGEFLEPEKLSAAIGQAIEQTEECIKSKILNLCVGVPGEFCTAISRENSISFKSRRKVTEIDVQELFDSGNFKNSNYTLINSSPVYYILDDSKKVMSPVGMSAGKLTGLLSFIFAENKFIQTMDKVLGGLNIKNFEFVSSVLAESVFLFDDKDKQYLLADIGYLTSSVSLFQGEGILYMKSFSAGGAHISADLMECLHLNFELAEQLKDKIKLNLQVSEEEKYKVVIKDESAEVSVLTANEIAAARIESLSMMLKKCLKDCPYNIAQNMPLYLTGGGISYIRGAKDILSATLDMNVEVIAPSMPQINKPHLSSAYGVLSLALKENVTEKKGFWAKLFGL